MIRFFTRFLKSYGILRRFINLRQVRLSQGLRSAVPARNLLLRFGQWGWVRQVLGLFIKSNLLLVLVSAIGCLAVSLIRFWLSSKGYGSYFEYIPFSIDECLSLLVTAFLVGSGWIFVISVNHFNDLSSMMFNNADAFASAFAFIYVSLWDVPKQFFTVLFTTPKEIWSTLVIQELVLFVATIGDAISIPYNLILEKSPDVISGYLSVFGKFVGAWWNTSINWIGSLIKVSFNGLVDFVCGLISPTDTGMLSSITNPIFRGLATTISIGLVLWILRTFFGFPS